MRHEISSPRTFPISMGRPPPGVLSDGIVTLRLPEKADILRLAKYGSDQSLLADAWIDHPPPATDVHEWASTMVEQWGAGWTDLGGIDGGVLIVDEQAPFVGIVFLYPLSPPIVELVYGVLPTARGRGIATRATRLAASWALTQGSFTRVELRIGENHAESRRVAENSGFQLTERFETYVTGTGQTYIDLVYARTK